MLSDGKLVDNKVEKERQKLLAELETVRGKGAALLSRMVQSPDSELKHLAGEKETLDSQDRHILAQLAALDFSQNQLEALAVWDARLAALEKQKNTIEDEIQSEVNAWAERFRCLEFPKDFTFDVRLPQTDFAVHAPNPEKGLWAWVAQCLDCGKRYSGNLQVLAETVLNSLQPDRIICENLMESLRSKTFNAITEIHHKHPRKFRDREREQAEKRHAKALVDETVRVEVRIKPSLAEPLDLAHVDLYRKVKKLRQKLEKFGDSENFEDDEEDGEY